MVHLSLLEHSGEEIHIHIIANPTARINVTRYILILVYSTYVPRIPSTSIMRKVADFHSSELIFVTISHAALATLSDLPGQQGSQNMHIPICH